MAHDKKLGWRAPTPYQQLRALRHSSPEAGDSILADIVPAPSSDLSEYTCQLDQSAIGSCASNAPAQAMYVAMKQSNVREQPYILSRLWLYFQVRYIEGTVNDDAGGNIGDNFAMLAAKGIPPESVYPYIIEKFKDDPGPTVDRAAYDTRGQIGVQYNPISSTGLALLTDVEKALTAGMAVTFGCAVSKAFCSTIPSGTVQVPGPKDAIAGGHALTVVGHDRVDKRLLVKNSWGDWCDPSAAPGCFWMAYSYFTSPMYGASDIWIVKALPKGLR